LLTLSSRVNAGIKESSKQTTIAQQHPQQFVVVNIYIVKSRRVKQIVSVNKYCHFSAMAELQRDIVRRVKVVHFSKLR